MDAYFTYFHNKEEGKDTVSVLYMVVCAITYADCPIIWASRIQIEISISTTEAKYIALLKAIRYVLPFSVF